MGVQKVCDCHISVDPFRHDRRAHEIETTAIHQ